MTTRATLDGPHTAQPGRQADPAIRPSTLVWIDSREAVIVRLRDGATDVERLHSDVPAHHRTTGHVRHDPGVHGGAPRRGGESNRLEHLRRFVDETAARIDPADDLLLIGPGTVHEQLARAVAADDARHGNDRPVTTAASGPLTDRQLAGRVRSFAGQEPRRTTRAPARRRDGAVRAKASAPRADAGPSAAVRGGAGVRPRGRLADRG